MFLRRLRIQNIRSIRDLTLDFSDPGGTIRAWTYLLGENGTGKSSVLRAIALVLAGTDALHELVADPNDWIQLGRDDASINVDFETQKGEQRKASVRFKRGSRIFEFVESNRATLEDIDAAVGKADRNYFIVGYGVSRRASDSRSQPTFSLAGTSPFRSRRAQSAATLFSSDATLVSIEQWAMDLDYRRGNEGIEAVRKALNQLLPDVSFATIDRERRSLMFNTPDGQLPMSALSDGYQAMAAWCGDLLWQFTETFEDYEDPLKARGLLLIDELDLHLHPLWQRQLVSFLKATLPNMQVIVTTHSPLTVHQAGAGELFVLRRDPNNAVVSQQFEGAPNKLMLHQLLQSPLFGLETLDSPQVQELRDQLRSLETGATQETEGAATAQIREIRKELEDVPSWREVPPYLQQTNEVLERIAAELGSGAGVDALASRAAPSADGDL